MTMRRMEKRVSVTVRAGDIALLCVFGLVLGRALRVRRADPSVTSRRTLQSMDAEVAVSLRFHFVQGIGGSRREMSQLSRSFDIQFSAVFLRIGVDGVTFYIDTINGLNMKGPGRCSTIPRF